MSGFTIRSNVHFGRGRRSKKELNEGEGTDGGTGKQRDTDVPLRLPRITKLMALAIRFEGLIRDGAVADYAELARLGHVTRARMTQIMALLHLAPDIQEVILFLPRVAEEKDAITEREMRPIVATMDWRKQRRMWEGRVGAHSVVSVAPSLSTGTAIRYSDS